MKDPFDSNRSTDIYFIEYDIVQTYWFLGLDVQSLHPLS